MSNYHHDEAMRLLKEARGLSFFSPKRKALSSSAHWHIKMGQPELDCYLADMFRKMAEDRRDLIPVLSLPTL